MARRRGSKRVPLIGNLALLMFALAGIWTIGLFKFAQTIPDTVEDRNTRTDAIAVLTGGSGRLDEGLELLSQDMAERLFVSGVHKSNDVRNLLDHSKRRPTDLQSRIVIGNAINTVGNADETAAWSHRENVKSLRLVTGAYHMPRSLLEFAHAMPEVSLIPHPVFPARVKLQNWWTYPGTAALITSEFNKFLLAWTRHGVEFLLMGKRPRKRVAEPGKAPTNQAAKWQRHAEFPLLDLQWVLFFVDGSVRSRYGAAVGASAGGHARSGPSLVAHAVLCAQGPRRSRF